MNILEIIQLRSAAYPLRTLGDQISASIRAGGDDSALVTIYRRTGLETDLAIHIRRPNDEGPGGPSDLGIRLAAALKAYGLVEHTLWEARQ